MAQMGLGYGSEFQLLRFMGRHRHELERTIIDALQEKQQTINDKNFDWLDFEYSDVNKVITGDRELCGLSFLEKKIDKGLYDKITSALQKAGSFISNWQHWDAVFVLDDCFYFVEAKAYIGELSSTNAHGGGCKKEILNFMRENMQPYGIWKSHIILTLLAKQDLLLLATTYLILVKSWRRGQFYFTPLDTLVFLCP